MEAAANPRLIHSGVCHGTLGELIQGPFIRNGELHIGLISLPVKKYSCMHFIHDEDGCLNDDLAGKDKCRRAIDIYLYSHRKQPPRGKWIHDSELLEGKGMASSTADIVATIRCLDAIFSYESSIESMTTILRQVERSDSVFLDNYALYLSGRQEVVHHFGSGPAFHACYIDEGDRIDTEQVGERLLSHYERHLSDYAANLDRAIGAFLKEDLAMIARCSTASAVLGQEAVSKRNLDVLLANQERYQADGIVAAHTGSLLGYLYIHKPGPMQMGELSSFFHRLGYQCRFVQTGF